MKAREYAGPLGILAAGAIGFSLLCSVSAIAMSDLHSHIDVTVQPVNIVDLAFSNIETVAALTQQAVTAFVPSPSLVPTNTFSATLTPLPSNTSSNTSTPPRFITATPTVTRRARPPFTATFVPTKTATHIPPPTKTNTHVPPPTFTASPVPPPTDTDTPFPTTYP